VMNISSSAAFDFPDSLYSFENGIFNLRYVWPQAHTAIRLG
jgi:hypothetical protein